MAYQTTIIAAVVALVMFMAIVVTILSVTHTLDEKSTPLLVTVFTGISSTVVALLAVLRSDRSVMLINKTNGSVEEMKENVKALEHKTVDMPAVPDSHSIESDG